MFGWLFGKRKKTIKVVQEVSTSGNGNRVVQSTTIVNQRGSKASGDIVGGNKYSTYRRDAYAPGYDPATDLLNPLNPLNPISPLSPLNPMNQPDLDPEPKVHSHSHSHSHDSGSSWSSHSHSHSHDSGSSYHSHDSSSSSSSYDSGSSSYSSSD